MHPKDFKTLNLALKASIDRLRALGYDVSDYKDGCSVPGFHKNITITTEYLRLRGIQFQLVTQLPGDLIYVGPGIYHQVINLGVCMAEAVNVGSPFWNAGADRFVGCPCESNAVASVPSNSAVDSVVRDRPAPILVCPTEGCSFATTWKEHLLAHLQQEADPTAPRKFMCRLCPRMYIQECHLNRHSDQAHGSGGKRKSLCSFCGKMQLPGNLRRHQAVCKFRPLSDSS